MTWVRLDDRFDEHPKVVRAGPLGLAMHVAALCYCNRNLTDGFIPLSTARRLLDLDGSDQKASKSLANWYDIATRLVAVGLWEVADGGWKIHDYLDFQPSKEQVLALQKVRKEAGSRGGTAKKEKRDQVVVANGKQTPSKTVAKGCPVPVPVPVPVKKESVPLDEAILAYNELAGETGLPKAQRLTDTRRSALRLRLEECGGLDGWEAALAKIRGSPFLRGENERGWRANLDFLLRQSNFTKLMEGAYDRPPTPDSTEAIRRGILAGMGDELGSVGTDAEGGDSGTAGRGNGAGKGRADAVSTQGAGGVVGAAVPHVGGVRGEGGRVGANGDIPGHVGADAGGLAGRGG